MTKYDQQIAALEKHAAVANEEMGIIKNDVAWIKEKLEKVETRTWHILAVIILGFLMTIAVNLWK